MFTLWNKRNPLCPSTAINCGRPSPWGNPFIIGRDGTREEVIEKYRVYAIKRNALDPSWLAPLITATDVYCWCTPKACHVEVIAEILSERTK